MRSFHSNGMSKTSRVGSAPFQGQPNQGRTWVTCCIFLRMCQSRGTLGPPYFGSLPFGSLLNQRTNETLQKASPFTLTTVLPSLFVRAVAPNCSRKIQCCWRCNPTKFQRWKRVRKWTRTRLVAIESTFQGTFGVEFNVGITKQ